MEAISWSLFGLLGAAMVTMLTAFWRLADRIEGVRRDLSARIDGVETGLGARFDAKIDALRLDLGERLDAGTARIDALNARMDTHMGRHLG